MSRFCSFLLCLVMLALPLQGFAAASMLYCGAGAEQRSVQTQAMPESHQHHHNHDAQGLNQPHAHTVQHDEASQSGPGQMVQSPDMQTPLPDTAHKCSVCASCCNLIGISDVSPALAPHLAPEIRFAEPLAVIYGVPSRLPEKPPRA
jgi:hypothetical protein